MHEYLIDRETLGQFVDALIEQKYPGQPTESFADYREKCMAVLDERIALAVFGPLSYDARNEVDALLADPDTSEDSFRAFFERHHIDLENIIKKTFVDFKNEFLGGNNA